MNEEVISPLKLGSQRVCIGLGYYIIFVFFLPLDFDEMLTQFRTLGENESFS
jgi:hypothetical protein